MNCFTFKFEAILSTLDSRSVPFLKVNHPETTNAILSSTAKVLSRLSPYTKIDSNLFYNPRELKDSPELIQDQLEAINLLDRCIRLISSLVDLFKLVAEGEDEIHSIDFSFDVRCELIHRLSCWLTVGYSNDEWNLDSELQSIIQSVADRLWKLPHRLENRHVHDWNICLEQASNILQYQIKPLFSRQNCYSRNVNPVTGKKIAHQQEHLFGPTSNSLDDHQLWKLEGTGFWNTMCALLERLHEDPGLKEIWPLLIPPIITLLDETTPRYRLRGLQLSISLIQHVPPSLLCQTGIDSLLRKSFSTTFGLLNLQQTYDLLNSAFEASMLLIQAQWDASQKAAEDQSDRYHQLHKLVEESIFNALTFGRNQEDDHNRIKLNSFVINRLTDMTRKLNYAIGRYFRIIVPYLCETLLDMALTRSNYWLVIRINRLINLLLETCHELMMRWGSRLIIVFASCWVEWRTGTDEATSSINSNYDQAVTPQELEQVKASIVKDAFEPFLVYIPKVGSDQAVNQDPALTKQLWAMIETMKQTTPYLNELFDPLLSK